MPRVLFQNADCLKRFGPPRSHVEYMKAIGTLKDEARYSRLQWLLQVSQVSLRQGLMLTLYVCVLKL